MTTTGSNATQPPSNAEAKEASRRSTTEYEDFQSSVFLRQSLENEASSTSTSQPSESSTTQSNSNISALERWETKSMLRQDAKQLSHAPPLALQQARLKVFSIRVIACPRW